MAVAITPNAFLARTPFTAEASFSFCCWRRIDTQQANFTVLTYAGHPSTIGGGGFQFTVDSSERLIVYNARTFADLLGGSGPILTEDTWYFFGLTTIVADIPNNVEIYWAAEGDPSLNQVTASYAGTYEFRSWYIGARPATAHGAGGVNRLNGSAALDRVWMNVTLTPSEMLAEFQSETPVEPSPWAIWDLDDAATAIDDTSGNDRDLTSTVGTGTLTTTDGPSFGGSEVGALSETDSLAAVSHQHSVTVPQLSESDSLASATRSVVKEAGVLTEADSVADPAHSRATGLAALAETDTLTALARSVSQQASALAEADTLNATARATSRVAALLAESDVLAALGEDEEVAALSEADTLLPAGHVTTRTVAAVAEIDVLAAVLAMVFGRVRTVTRARPTAETITRAKSTVDMEVTAS